MASNYIFYDNIVMKDFKWLMEESWDDECRAFFASCRDLSNIRSMKKISDDQSKSKITRWILIDDKKRKVACAECDLNTRKFSISRLFTSVNFENTNLNYFQNALSVLISSIFISSATDLIKLHCDDHSVCRHVADQQWGEEHRILIPNRFFYLPEAKSVVTEAQLFSISHEDWFETQRGKDDKKQLHYLEVKRDRLVKKHDCSCKKTRAPRSIVGTFLRGMRV